MSDLGGPVRPKTLPRVPNRLRLPAVLLQRRGAQWATGIGSVALGMIERELRMHATEAEAEGAAIALADSLDMLAVRA